LHSPETFYATFCQEMARHGSPPYPSAGFRAALCKADQAEEEVRVEVIRQRAAADYDVAALLARRRQCGRAVRRAIEAWLESHGL